MRQGDPSIYDLLNADRERRFRAIRINSSMAYGNGVG